jgi:hypothetical protein
LEEKKGEEREELELEDQAAKRKKKKKRRNVRDDNKMRRKKQSDRSAAEFKRKWKKSLPDREAKEEKKEVVEDASEEVSFLVERLKSVFILFFLLFTLFSPNCAFSRSPALSSCQPIGCSRADPRPYFVKMSSDSSEVCLSWFFFLLRWTLSTFVWFFLLYSESGQAGIASSPSL